MIKALITRNRYSMCFGIPMQIKKIDRFIAHCEARGTEREVNLFMMQHEEWTVGDYLVSHLGQAIQKVTQEEAETAWALYDEMMANTVPPDA